MCLLTVFPLQVARITSTSRNVSFLEKKFEKRETSTGQFNPLNLFKLREHGYEMIFKERQRTGFWDKNPLALTSQRQVWPDFKC